MKFFSAILILFWLPQLLPAQETSDKKSESEQQETDEQSVVLIPLPKIYSGSAEGPLPLVLSGAFINPAEGGVEITYSSAYEPYYGNLYISSMFGATRRVPNARQMFTAGLSIGREKLLPDRKGINTG